MSISTLPLLDGEYALSAEQVARYQRDGHLCLRGVLSEDEVGAWREAIREAAYRNNREGRKLEERDEYGKSFLQITDLWEKAPEIAPFTLSRRLGKIAADLMGVRSARLYHDQALFKEPGGTPSHWHQDQTFMPFDTPHLIGLWVALVPVPLEVGSMTFVSGSHRLGWLGKLPWTSEAGVAVQEIVRKHDLEYASYGEMRPGDVTLHSAWTLHSAKGNPTANVRQIMNVFYLDGEARITEPMTQTHATGLKYNLGGRGVGQLPDSPHNPVVYER